MIASISSYYIKRDNQLTEVADDAIRATASHDTNQEYIRVKVKLRLYTILYEEYR